jgi:purine-binding chemotaxis protein CheW
MSEEQFIAFKLNQEEFVIPIAQVQEILLPQPVTAIPQSGDLLEGIINLRGTVVPVVDLKKRFFSIPSAAGENSCLIVVKLGVQLVGVFSDSISEVVTLREDQISAPSELLKTSMSSGIRGVGRLNDRLVLILDLSVIFSDTEIDLLKEAAV